MPLRINSSLAAAASLSKLGFQRSSASRAASIAPLLLSGGRANYWTGTPEGRQFEDPRELPREEQPTEIKKTIVNPADTLKARSDQLHTYGKYLMSCLPKHIQQFSVWKDELTLHVAPSSILPLFTFLKNHTAAQFTQVSDIAGVDYPTRSKRFEVVYNLLSIRHNARIRVKTYADEVTPVPSITGLYDGVNWYEREAYDLFGVFFVGHPDLRRILTDYGFDGHPLRKDFPLTGYTEVRYDEEKKRVVQEPLELTQAFRNFQGGSSVWEQVGEGRDLRPEDFKLPKPEPEEEKKDDQKK